MKPLSNFFRRIWFSSIRRQLMFGITLVHALLMILFIVDLVDRQRDFLHTQAVSQTQGLTKSLAANSALWVLAKDFIGLEELIDTQMAYPGLSFAMITDLNGRILGHTNRDHVGQYLQDEISKNIFKGSTTNKILQQNSNLIDIASPVLSNGKHIAWARVALSQEGTAKELKVLGQNGIAYTSIAIFVGILFAWLMAKGLTSTLHQMTVLTKKIRSGERDLRLNSSRKDELGMVAQGFDEMISTLESNEKEVHERGDRISAVMDNVIDGIVTIDTEGVIESFNKSAEKLFGYNKKEIVGRNISMLMPANYADKHDEYLARFSPERNNAIGSGARELLALRKDGSTLPVDIAISNATIGDKNIFIGVIRDISERKAAREALLNANSALEKRVEERTQELNDKNHALDEALAVANEATRSKSEFLANMSHEIRTPMNGVLGMLDILQDSEMPREQKEFVETAFNSGETLLALLNDILDFSKIEAGKLDLEYIPFNIRRATEDVASLLAERACSKGLELIIDLPSTLPTMVMGDSTRVRQIITNLAGNAIKFTNEGEIVIRVSILKDSGQDLLLRFDIRDTGIGINELAQSKIFDSFSQADGTTTRKFGGTGLGLSISRQLAELMGGEIGVISSPLEGSTFWFTMKTRKANEDKNQPDAAAPIDISNYHCLVVDDNQTNRRILEHQLSEWKVTFKSVEDGKQGVEEVAKAIAEKKPFDFILMDMMMPIMDGLQASTLIEEQHGTNRPKIIMLTSMGGGINEISKDTNAFDAFIHKPVRQFSLLNSISDALSLDTTKPSYNNSHLTNEDAEKTETANNVVENNIQATPLKILIAEDNKINQRVASAMLNKLGFSDIAIAENGESALQFVRDGDFDVVLMDCQMPKMDGYQATESIRKLNDKKAEITIIAMTANAMRGDKEKCINAGMDDYLSKPIKKEELGNILEKWLPK